MSRFSKLVVLCVIAMSLFTACNDIKYNWIKYTAKASGEVYDSLFLGIHFGMKRDAFFDHCWDLNKQQLIKEGPGSTTVEYILDDELDKKGIMLFHPEFQRDQIYEMKLTLRYDAWAPWNKDLHASVLQEDVKGFMERWYGDGFITMDNEKLGKLYVKIDGNRRITIKQKDDQFVEVYLTDLKQLDAVMAKAAAKKS